MPAIDNGKGMAKSELSRITEAFYMVDKSRSRKEHSAGLGLALSSKIAEIHGSTLRFRSEEGRGTMANVHLNRAVRRRDNKNAKKEKP